MFVEGFTVVVTEIVKATNRGNTYDYDSPEIFKSNVWPLLCVASLTFWVNTWESYVLKISRASTSDLLSTWKYYHPTIKIRLHIIFKAEFTLSGLL